MGVYLYCVARPPAAPAPGIEGLDGRPVRAEPLADFHLWVSDLPRPPAASLEAVRVHNAVVEAATVTATPLPSRFGQWFDSAAELERSVHERRAQLHRSIEAVDGALEHGVRVVDPDHDPLEPDRSTGKAYMEALARRARNAELETNRGREVAAALRDWMGPLVRDERVRPGGAGTLAIIAHLVDRHDTGNYGRRVREFPGQRPELRFLFSGPWPPYGFVEG